MLKFNLIRAEGIIYLGGLAIWLAFLLICIPYLKIQGFSANLAWGIILSSIPIVAFGIIDDYKSKLPLSRKFLIQIIATSLLIIWGIRTDIVYIGPVLNLLVTFLWILGITNAFSQLDLIKGLSWGVAAISAGAFFLVALFTADLAIGAISLALMGISIGLLWYNFSVRGSLGKSGSYLAGFILAAIALAISYAPLERKIALFSPLLILGFPLFNLTFFIVMRLISTKPIAKSGNNHLALRFLQLGYSKSKVLLFMFSLSLLFSLTGVYLIRASNIIGLIIIGSIVAISLAIFKKMSKIAVDG